MQTLSQPARGSIHTPYCRNCRRLKGRNSAAHVLTENLIENHAQARHRMKPNRWEFKGEGYEQKFCVLPMGRLR